MAKKDQAAAEVQATQEDQGMEFSTGETKAEQKAKGNQETKGQTTTEEKKETPSYPKWPEAPAAYTQTIRDKGNGILSNLEEHSPYTTMVQGARAAFEQVLPTLDTREEAFKAAGAKAWILKSELTLHFTRVIEQGVEVPKDLKHQDLQGLYRNGANDFITLLAKGTRVEL